MIHAQQQPTDDHVVVVNAEGQSSVVVVCEHASCFIPKEFKDLGLAADALQSHAAWDPGALAVAQGLATRIDAPLVASGVSRLVYDCNRPPSAHDAMPHQSEAIVVPDNVNLSPAQREDRAARFYEPFRACLSDVLATRTMPIIVTIHSFTPIYYGEIRAVEIGVLHDADSRLADAMLQVAPVHTCATVLRNEPYGPEHGVTHTLKEHALQAGYLNVMLEVRNDLIATAHQQDAMAESLANWLTDALAHVQAIKDVSCQA